MLSVISICTDSASSLACAAMLAQSGVKKLVYLEEYRDSSGILLLKDCNIEVLKYQI